MEYNNSILLSMLKTCVLYTMLLTQCSYSGITENSAAISRSSVFESSTSLSAVRSILGIIVKRTGHTGV